MSNSLALIILCVGVFGLIIGSFLNVVIYRYPIMLKTKWREDCSNYLSQHPTSNNKQAKFTLWLPRSQCPACKTTITWWQNIPLISYILLRGKCSACKTKIAKLYPIIELLTAGLTITTALQFKLSYASIAAVVFTWGLIILSCIDFQEKILPDNLTLPLLWLGLLVNVNHLFTSIKYAIYGAVVGYLALWIIAKVFLFLRKKDGLGFGDFKMLAMLGE